MSTSSLEEQTSVEIKLPVIFDCDAWAVWGRVCCFVMAVAWFGRTPPKPMLQARLLSVPWTVLLSRYHLNSVVRETVVFKPTILKLLADLGTACAARQDGKLPRAAVQACETDEFGRSVGEKMDSEQKRRENRGMARTPDKDRGILP
jgi:hypothetical protein